MADETDAVEQSPVAQTTVPCLPCEEAKQKRGQLSVVAPSPDNVVPSPFVPPGVDPAQGGVIVLGGHGLSVDDVDNHFGTHPEIHSVLMGRIADNAVPKPSAHGAEMASAGFFSFGGGD